jgi:hypothetical protein
VSIWRRARKKSRIFVTPERLQIRFGARMGISNKVFIAQRLLSSTAHNPRSFRTVTVRGFVATKYLRPEGVDG